MPEYRHDYFSRDIDEALSHCAHNLNQVHEGVEEWDHNADDYSWRVQDWLLELTEAVQFLGALVTAHRQEHKEKEWRHEDG